MGRPQLLLRLSPVPRTPVKMPASPSGTSAETTKQGMPPYPRLLPKQSQGRWQRLMHITRLFSMREAQPPSKPALKYLQEQMVLRLWIPSIGPRTNLSTKDGNCGQKRLDSPLMPWKVTQKKKILTSIIGLMEKEWDTLSHGKTAKPSSASPHMMNEKHRRQVLFRMYRKLLYTV